MHEKNMMATLYYGHKVAVELQQWRQGYGSVSPLSIVCWCLAVQINLLIPSITWLLESSSFSFGFLLRKITGKGERSKVIYKRAKKNTLIMRNPQSLVSQVMEDAAALLAQSLLGEAS